MTSADACSWLGCLAGADMTYKGAPLCSKHWAEPFMRGAHDITKYILAHVTPAAAEEIRSRGNSTKS